MRRNVRSQKGFTLIELMLAMGFFSAILIASTVVIIQVFAIYNKGLATQQINSLGRRLTDDTIRVGNNATGKVSVGAGTQPRCVVLGDNVYIWSYASDTALDSTVFKSGTPQQPVPFSLYQAGTTCPNPSTPLTAAQFEPLLGENIRVYNTDMRVIGAPGEADLLKFKLVLGTYGGPGSPDNPTINAAGIPSCATGDLGNFCAFSTYDTVIYLPNL